MIAKSSLPTRAIPSRTEMALMIRAKYLHASQCETRNFTTGIRMNIDTTITGWHSNALGGQKSAGMRTEGFGRGNRR